MKNLSLALLLFAPACFGQVEFIRNGDGVTVRWSGKERTTLHFGGDTHKPWLGPLRAPSGIAITRDPSEGAPYGGGQWVGHGAVNGVDYFETDPRVKSGRPTGSQVFRKLVIAGSVARHGSGRNHIIAFASDWVDPAGQAVITERRSYHFGGDYNDDFRFFDVEVRLHANHKAEFADSQNCLLGLRLTAPFEERNGGEVSDILGPRGAKALNGKRAVWVSFEGTVGNERIAVTVMDHPDNYGFPARWKIDEDGYVFAAPFAERAFQAKDRPLPPVVRDMGMTLEAGQELVFRYRILIHPLTLDRQACWRMFALAPLLNYSALTAPETK